MVDCAEGYTAPNVAVHNRALAGGVEVSCKTILDADTTIIEYRGARGCYIYFAAIRGSYRILLSIEEVLKIWPVEEMPMPMSRVSLVLMN